MAQYRLNAYDADVFIPEFKGLMQYGDQMGDDLRFSPDCMNVETPGGVLQPAPLMRKVKLYTGENTYLTAADGCTMMCCRVTNYLSQPISVHFKYMNTFGVETSTYRIINPNVQSDDYVFIVGTNVYAGKLPLPSVLKALPAFDYITGIEVDNIKTMSYADTWSWCTYEVNYGTPDPSLPPPQPSGRTNVIVMTSEKNGVYYYGGLGLKTMTGAPENFRCVARYSERIWGVGTGNDRDCLFYSRPYSITSWSQNNTEPADGGGQIREATFDKDQILALVPFGDVLIAFSELRAWRITGTDPTNFSIQEQYGNGTRYPNSIAVLGDRIIMLGEHGLESYDGYQVAPFLKENTYELFRETQFSPTGFQSPSAIVVNSKYILALSNKLYYNSGSLVSTGFRFLVYDMMDGSTTIMDAPFIEDFCVDHLGGWAMINVPIENASNQIQMMELQFDSWYMKSVLPSATKWVTPWITFERKDIQKGGFELYFYPELNTDDTTASVTLKFSIQTEKKTKSKNYVVHALTSDERTADKKHKQKRLHFGGAGRRFRLTIETAAGNTVPWRLIGGIHIIAEIDKD